MINNDKRIIDLLEDNYYGGESNKIGQGGFMLKKHSFEFNMV